MSHDNLDQMGDASKTYCSLLWTHLCVRPDFTVTPCCRFSKDLDPALQVTEQGTFDYNHSALQDIRNRMLLGEKVDGCQACYEEESTGSGSLRQTSNQQFQPKQPLSQHGGKEDIQYLEIFVGSTCNLRCVSCSPALSSSILQDYKKLGLAVPHSQTFKEPTDLKDLQNFNLLKKIKFVGGEPLLSPLHKKIIETLSNKDVSNLELVYYTNVTQRPSQTTLELWKKCRKVLVNLSIDAVEERNEYLRMNSKWIEVQNIADQFFKLSEDENNIELQLSTTVSVLNLPYLQELDDWYRRQTERFPRASSEPPYMTYVTDPGYLSPHSAPETLIDELLSEDSSHFSEQHRKILRLLQNNRSQRSAEAQNQKMIHHLSQLESLRQNSWRKTFPRVSAHFG